jgi:hypothetical protein
MIGLKNIQYYGVLMMTKTTIKSAPKVGGTPTTTEPDDDADDLFDNGDYAPLPVNLDEETVKRDSRRKIEIYWEKKRLKEQFEDFDDSEFGF